MDVETVKITREPDYFPLMAGYRLVYHHTSTEFEGIETVVIVLGEVKGFKEEATTSAALKRTRMGKVQEARYEIRRTRGGVWSGGGVLGLARLEFPRPPLPGKTWTEPPDRHEIASLEATIEVPAGKFHRCLRVNTFLAGGDGGSAIRYYAPGVGYAYEEYSDENWGSRVKLVSFETPGPRGR